MTETLYDDIRAALDSVLVGATGLPALVFPGDEEPRQDTPYVRVNFAPGLSEPTTLGSNPDIRTSGIYDLLVCHRRSLGSGVGLRSASKLVSLFPAHSVVERGSTRLIIQSSGVGRPYPDEPFYCTPVRVNWYIHHRGE